MELDDVDRGILHMLQKDARNNNASIIADNIGVAPNTVRSRIERLEENGVIDGYRPTINYEEAGFQLHVIFICTVPVATRSSLADELLAADGVVGVKEIMSGRENLAVEVVGEDSDQITSIAARLEEIGCSISNEWFLKKSRDQPFDNFGKEETDR